MHRHHQRTVSVLAAALLPALLCAGCAALKSGGDDFNKPPVYEGPGCYDHKGRLERTVRIKRECDELNWVWKTAPP